MGDQQLKYKLKHWSDHGVVSQGARMLDASLSLTENKQTKISLEHVTIKIPSIIHCQSWRRI